MKFPYAHKGIVKVYIAEVLAVIGAILALTGAILAAIPGAATAGGGLSTASLILFVLGFILQMVGLYQGGKDEANLRVAFYLIVVGIVIALTSVILSFIPGLPAIVGSSLAIASGLVELLVIIYTIYGIVSLAVQLRDSYMANFGKRLALFIAILYVASSIMSVIPKIIGASETQAVVITMTVLSIVAAVLQLVSYVLFFVYLHKATKMLKK